VSAQPPFLNEYIRAAGIKDDKRGPLFRSSIGRTKKLSGNPMSRVDAWYMVRRRARDAGIEAPIGNHSFRAIGITDYLERGGDINIAKRMAGHSNVKTTDLYDRRGDEKSFSEIAWGFNVGDFSGYGSLLRFCQTRHSFDDIPHLFAGGALATRTTVQSTCFPPEFFTLPFWPFTS
jgi:Phage integrase family